MDVSFDFQPMDPRHDLLIERDERDEGERIEMQPSLDSRMCSMMDALNHLAV